MKKSNLQPRSSNQSKSILEGYLFDENNNPIPLQPNEEIMKERQKLHNEWWNSLTDKQKQKLVEEQLAMEKQRENEQR